jgi:hypothetical protein
MKIMGKKGTILKPFFLVMLLLMANTLVAYAPKPEKSHYERKGANVDNFVVDGEIYGFFVRNTIKKTSGKPSRLTEFVVQVIAEDAWVTISNKSLNKGEFKWSTDHCQLETELTIDETTNTFYAIWETTPPTEVYQITWQGYTINGIKREASVEVQWGDFTLTEWPGTVWHTEGTR